MFRNWQFLLLPLSFVALASLSVLAQGNQTGGMSVLYDPKLETPLPKLEPKLVARIIKDLRAFPVFKDMRTDGSCSSRGEFEPWPSPPVVAVAKGSFTRSKSDQVLYIIEPCTGPLAGDMTPTAVLVYEKEKLVSVFRFSSTIIFTGFREGFSVRDIDQNGLSELAVVMSGGDGCGGWTNLHLIQWKSQQPFPFGTLNVASVGCGSSTEYTLYVNKATTPTFVGAEYGRDLKLTLLKLEKPSITITTLR